MEKDCSISQLSVFRCAHFVGSMRQYQFYRNQLLLIQLGRHLVDYSLYSTLQKVNSVNLPGLGSGSYNLQSTYSLSRVNRSLMDYLYGVLRAININKPFVSCSLRGRQLRQNIYLDVAEVQQKEQMDKFFINS